jgi:ubiquinone biosynthesis protein
MAPPTLLTAVRDLDRLRQIVAVLVRYGFGELLSRTPLANLVVGKSEARANQTVGERLRMVIEDLGPSFVKLGQIASTRPDLVPTEVLRELKKLQDQVPPIPFEAVRAQVEAELDAPLEELFEWFDEKPLASASIGQVHRATYRSEEGALLAVVVKVQRPNIKPTIEKDVELLYLLAQAVERSIPDAKLHSPVKMVAEFDRSVTAELDFQLEADHAIRFAKNFEGHTDVRFPRVYRPRSGKRVLTLEFFEGRKIHAAVAEGFDPEKIARATLSVLIKQVFEDGFFHADPHPGNVILMGEPDAPVIGLIDLGLVGRLTPQLRDKTIDLMVAAVQEDYRGIAEALYAIGTPTKRIDRRAFEAEVTQQAQKYLGRDLGDIQVSAMVRDVVAGAVRFGLEIPADFLMFGKAIMTLEGVAREIAPHFDLFEEMRPYFARLVVHRYSPERMLPELLRSVGRIASSANEFPVQASEILEDLRRGKLEVRTREPSMMLAADLIGRRIYSGFVVGALVIGGALLASQGQLTLAVLFIVTSLAWGSAHTLSAMWTSRKKR